MIILEVKRYGITNQFKCESIKEAINDALSDLDNNLSFPSKIIKNDTVIWEFNNIYTLRDELEKLKIKED